MKTLITAAFVAPMNGPVLRDAGVVIHDNRIVDVGATRHLHQAHPDALPIDTGNAILLPGLINSHTHLELSFCQAGERAAAPFHEWILQMRGKQGAEDHAKATASGIEQSLDFGVTCVGDITQHPHITRAAINASKLKAVSFSEVLGLGKRRSRFDELLASAIDASPTCDRVRVGISPHSPYTVDLPGYKQCVAWAIDRRLPLATHLAESPDEQDFLYAHRGPFREMWDSLGQWSDDIETFPGSPIAMAKAIGLLDQRAVLAHVNYCNDDELATLARGNASVIYCPRTHRYFGHPPHRLRDMLARGINVAVGTDSCASSPDLNIVDDLRLLHEIAPDFAVESLWELVTIRAARALGLAGVTGQLSQGAPADIAVFAARTNDPLREILEEKYSPLSVWIEGEQRREGNRVQVSVSTEH